MRLTIPLLALVLASGSASAQLRPGTLLEDGRVVVKVFVTMPDSLVPAGRPIGNVEILLSSSDERYTAATDGAGTAMLFAIPGSYRVSTLQPVDWNGKRHVWNVALDVRPGMSVLDLTPLNAAGVSSVPPSLAAAQPTRAATRSGFGPKDPGTAQVLSFLFTGMGQIYAGETAAGLVMFVVGETLTIVTLSALLGPCGTYGECERNESALWLAAGGAAFLWIYSMVDADDAVRRWNESHGFVAAHPIVGGDRDGVRLGLSLTF